MTRTKFYEFVSKCYKLPVKERRKYDDKAVEKKFLGYDQHAKCCRISIGSSKVIMSREVCFVLPCNDDSDDDEDNESLFDF